jgi:hypothetical protein
MLTSRIGPSFIAPNAAEVAVRDIHLAPKEVNADNGRTSLWVTCPEAKFRDGKKVVELAPNNIGTLAAAYAEAADFDSAVKWQSQAIASLRGLEDHDAAWARTPVNFRSVKCVVERSGLGSFVQPFRPSKISKLIFGAVKELLR